MKTLSRVLSWESKPRSAAALFAFVLGVWLFYLSFSPFPPGLAFPDVDDSCSLDCTLYQVRLPSTHDVNLPFLRNMMVHTLSRKEGGGGETTEVVEVVGELEEEEGDNQKASTLKQMQDIVLQVQVGQVLVAIKKLFFKETTGWIASQLESIQNAFNFSSTPFLTLIGFAITALATIVLYLIPIRYAFFKNDLQFFKRYSKALESMCFG